MLACRSANLPGTRRLWEVLEQSAGYHLLVCFVLLLWHIPVTLPVSGSAPEAPGGYQMIGFHRDHVHWAPLRARPATDCSGIETPDGFESIASHGQAAAGQQRHGVRLISLPVQPFHFQTACRAHRAGGRTRRASVAKKESQGGGDPDFQRRATGRGCNRRSADFGLLSLPNRGMNVLTTILRVDGGPSRSTQP